MRAAHTHRSVTALRGRSSRRGVCMRGAAAMPSCNGSAQPASGKRVAVIGAGASGLAVLRELLREGHDATVFEQGPRPGGTWVYEETSPTSDGVKHADAVHSSMYKHLRTNLPRELMGFTDFPFSAAFPPSADARRFCGHAEVLAYLDAFAAAHGLHAHVRYGRRVRRAAPLAEPAARDGGAPRWRVATCCATRGDQAEEADFDAVAVCNGHYSVPRTPALPGAGAFPGRQMHSHDYRDAAPFAGLAVLVVGASASGEDISREIAEVADTVYLSARSWRLAVDGADRWDARLGRRRNVLPRPEVCALLPDGGVSWHNGCAPAAGVDVVVYATGYHYTFDFLDDARVFTVRDNWVAPLYQHVFPPACPSLALIGLPWKVVPFPQVELQGRWLARVLSGAARLPTRAAMEAAVAAHAARLAAAGVPVRRAHLLGDEQWAYNDWLAAAAGADVPRLPAWRRRMYEATGDSKAALPDSYRDGTAYAPDLLAEVAADLARQQRALAAAVA